MANYTSTDVQVCINGTWETFIMVLIVFAIPIHAFIIKILAMDFQLDLARHKVLLSLSISDMVMLCGMFITALIYKAATFTIHSTGCIVNRGFTVFISCSTLAVSSVSIIALSIERYIACVHSFHLHLILTESRIRYWSTSTWILGCLTGLLAASTNHYDEALMVSNYSPVQYIYLIFVIPTSTVATVIQIRLFIFSWKKINEVSPAGAFGEELELVDLRKKQIKVAFMAGIVAFAFVVCMIPLAVVFMYELASGALVSASFRGICISLSFTNGLVDPLIYGFGIADTRQKMFRDLKRLKQFLRDMLPENVW